MSKCDVFDSHKMRGSGCIHELTSLIDCIRDIKVGYGSILKGSKNVMVNSHIKKRVTSKKRKFRTY